VVIGTPVFSKKTFCLVCFLDSNLAYWMSHFDPTGARGDVL